ncbi:MAG TPA: AAA family ATPase, partial [Vicinamibacterales bacterium]|nr:AAA family ATPase [Vicinamibacterales bacterium]
GHSVIADAVYARQEDRLAIAGVAAVAGVPFAGLWLEAPENTMIDRVARRRRDASDADVAVIRRQQALDVGSIAWRRIDAARSPEAVLEAAAAALAVSREDLGSRSLPG